MRILGDLRRCLRGGWFAVLPLLSVPFASAEIADDPEDRLKARISGVRIPFIANAGQSSSAVAYYASTLAGTVFVTRDGNIVYSLAANGFAARGRGLARGRDAWSLTETPVLGRARPRGSDPASTGVSYFLGNDPTRWSSGLPTFDAVSLGEVWTGISLDLRVSGTTVEKLYRVEPGGDPSRISMEVAGARSLRVDRAGALVAGTGLGDVTFTAPQAFQEHGGKRRAVRVSYALRGRQYGFRLGDYDPTLPVVIDPLLQSTFLGGNDSDQAFAMAIHPVSGEVYVAGEGRSTNFPGTTGGAQPTTGGGLGDAFVARLNSTLTKVNQATYVGGNSRDNALALAIHPVSGEIYVAGFTLSTNFPGTSGGAQPASGGGFSQAFVVRLNAALTTLQQATYLGGGGTDEALALAIHPVSGDVYAAGDASSASLPGTAGGAQPFNSGGFSDGFVTRLNAALTAVLQTTFHGGGGSDTVYALAIQPGSGDVYAGGSTSSTNLPGTAGGAQASNGGGTGDAFVARWNAALSTLRQSTYLGGSGTDDARAIAFHPASGELYAAGGTASTNLPGTGGGAQPAKGAGSPQDGYVARMNAALTALAQATYLGGSGYDRCDALAVNPTSGDVYVAGGTGSTNLPGTSGGAQSAKGPNTTDDAYAARFNAALTSLLQSTYLGGGATDDAAALAIHPATGDVYLAGSTSATAGTLTSFPGTSGGAQVSSGGAPDAFISRLASNLALVGCSVGPTTLCLNAGRFRVQAQWTTADGQTGAAQAVLLTGDTGYFWFFSANNVEMVVKVVDGRGFNSRFWVFAGGLTNVNVVLTVTDTATGSVKTYTNPQGVAFQPIQDTNAFVGAGAVEAAAGIPDISSAGSAMIEVEAPCVPDATTLCLNGGRYQVRTQWNTPQGQSGSGQAVSLTSDTGYFWFFSANNVEMVVKAVTGCGFNQRYWVFAGGLTNVNVVMTVTDTQTGAVKTYTNPQGAAFQPIQDTAAFLCP